MDESLLAQCARKIKIWPRLNAQALPVLPKGCSFVVVGSGGYKIVIFGRIFDKDHINKEKKRLAKEDK